MTRLNRPAPRMPRSTQSTPAQPRWGRRSRRRRSRRQRMECCGASGSSTSMCWSVSPRIAAARTPRGYGLHAARSLSTPTANPGPRSRSARRETCMSPRRVWVSDPTRETFASRDPSMVAARSTLLARSTMTPLIPGIVSTRSRSDRTALCISCGSTSVIWSVRRLSEAWYSDRVQSLTASLAFAASLRGSRSTRLSTGGNPGRRGADRRKPGCRRS